MPEPRRETECLLKCPTCGGTPFRLLRIQVLKPDGTIGDAWRNQLWPNAPGVEPPLDPRHIVCPRDRTPLVRVAP